MKYVLLLNVPKKFNIELSLIILKLLEVAQSFSLIANCVRS